MLCVKAHAFMTFSIFFIPTFSDAFVTRHNLGLCQNRSSNRKRICNLLLLFLNW